MAVKKDFLQIELKSGKLKIGIAILIVLACSFLVRLTPLVHIFWINYLTALIVGDWFILFIICGLLFGLHYVDVQRFREMLAKEDEKNVH